MMTTHITSESQRTSKKALWINLGLLICIGIAVCIGITASIFPLTIVIAMALLALGVIFVIILTMPRRHWWRLWLVTLAIAAFGPFLDILSRLPINWILGSVILVLPFIVLIRAAGASSKQTSQPTQEPQALPLLGLSFMLYTLYIGLQTLRPDVEFWSALMVFRIPLIGLAAYLITSYAIQSPSQAALLVRMQQFAKLFIVIGIIVAAYGIFQYLVGFERLQMWGLVEPDGLYIHNQRNLDGGTAIFRIFSTMRRNEVLGVFLYLNIVISVAALYFHVKPRGLILLNVALSLVTLLLALSLTNLVVPLVWVASIILLTRSKRLWRGLLVTLPVAIGTLVLTNWWLNNLIIVRVQEHFLDTQDGIGRLAMMQNWFQNIAGRPLWQIIVGSGICSGGDADVLARLQGVLNTAGITIGQTPECSWSQEVHDNWYATHSLEVGILGLVLFWLFFALVAIYALPTLRRRWPAPERNGWFLLALGILALFPSGFVGASILYMPVVVYFWSLLAIIDAASKRFSRA